VQVHQSLDAAKGSVTGIVPALTMTHSFVGPSKLSVGTFSIARTTSMPSITLPNTTCFPSSQDAASVVMKNCEPFVSTPDKTPDKVHSKTRLRSKTKRIKWAANCQIRQVQIILHNSVMMLVLCGVHNKDTKYRY